MNYLATKIVSLQNKDNTFRSENCKYIGKLEMKLRMHMKKNHKGHYYCDKTRHLLWNIEKLEKLVLKFQGEIESTKYISR